MFLITERNLIYEYIPLDLNNSQKAKFTFPITKNNTTIHRGYWGAEESMLLDVLFDKYRRMAYQNRKPRKNDSDVKNYMSKIEINLVNNEFHTNEHPTKKIEIAGIVTTYKEIVSEYGFLKKYSPKKFQALCERVANIQISGQYKYVYRHIENKYNANTGKEKTIEYPSKTVFKFGEPLNLIRFVYKDTELTKHSAPRVLDQKYAFAFQSGLSLLMAYNVTGIEWEWISSRIYNLSKNAQNLYRKYVLTRKKGSVITVPLSDLKSLLNIFHHDSYLAKKSIEKYLDEIQLLGIIKWQRMGKYNYVSYEICKEMSNLNKDLA